MFLMKPTDTPISNLPGLTRPDLTLRRPVRVTPSAASGPVESPAHADWLELTRSLLDLPTSPFHEHRLVDRVLREAAACGLTPTRDAHGNVLIDLPCGGESAAVPLVLSAHADHPGFWAGPMIGRRTLRAHWIGRVPRSYFAGAAVRFHPDGGEAVGGRVTAVSDYRGEGDYAAVEVEVEAAVPAGSIGQWALPPAELTRGRLHATAVDDVAGVAAMLCVMRELAERGAARPVRLLITRAEEAGFVGCVGYCRDQAAAGRAGRSQIVGIEMSKAMPEAPVGSGPIVRVGDRRSVFDAVTTADCLAAAAALAERDLAFGFQRRLMPGGTCESSVFQSLLGRSGAVCLPLGNYHNVDEAGGRLSREYIAAGDFVQLVKLLLALTEHPASEPGEPAAAGDWCDELWDRHAHLLHDPLSRPKGVEA